MRRSSSAWYLSESIFLFLLYCWENWCVEGVAFEEVPMFMEFSTSKGDVFIVYCLIPFFIFVFDGYRSWEGFGDVQETHICA